MLVKRMVCSRCSEWHQRLLFCWDNMKEEQTLLCLDCIAELISGRIPNIIHKSDVREFTDNLSPDKIYPIK